MSQKKKENQVIDSVLVALRSHLCREMTAPIPPASKPKRIAPVLMMAATRKERLCCLISWKTFMVVGRIQERLRQMSFFFFFCLGFVANETPGIQTQEGRRESLYI